MAEWQEDMHAKLKPLIVKNNNKKNKQKITAMLAQVSPVERALLGNFRWDPGPTRSHECVN